MNLPQPTHDANGERIPYSSLPKDEPTGRGMINPAHLVMLEKTGEDHTQRESPIRAFGESESRQSISRMNVDRLFEQYAQSTLGAGEGVLTRLNDLGRPEFVKLGQIEQVFMGRGSSSMVFPKEPLKNAEYFNRKSLIGKLEPDLLLTAGNADFDGNALSGPPPEPERNIPRFIFEHNTILYRDLADLTVKVRLPYKECLFVQQLYADLPEPTAPKTMQEHWIAENNPKPQWPNTYEIYALELSETKIFFVFDLYGEKISVQVNRFRSKANPEHCEYRAYLVEGPDKQLPADHEHQANFKDPAFRTVAPVLAFLEGMSQGVYTLEREGVQVPPSMVPPPAKEGIEFKVRSLIPNQPVKESVCLGGTHASPREHHRRGYWRRSASGKKVWIGPVVVNKGKTEGKIIKDYQIVDPTK